MYFADKATKYFFSLSKAKKKLPGEISLINPYEKKDVQKVVKEFCQKFFNDNNERRFVLGINPGRFGGGLTGISFTDPVALREYCGIGNNLGNLKELSSKFIYRVIEERGGAMKFYSEVFLSALYPFALIKDRRNYNYYDTQELAERLKDEIVNSIKSQLEFGAKRDLVIILGKKNADYFSALNKEYNFFQNKIVLEHPRYIMQYRLKNVDYYVSKYLDALNS
jgi:hypothetical protein